MQSNANQARSNGSRAAAQVLGALVALAVLFAGGEAFAAERRSTGAKLQVSAQVVATCTVDTRASVNEEELLHSTEVGCRGAAAAVPQVSAPVTITVDGETHRYAVATLNF